MNPLPSIALVHPSGSRAEVSLHGAHVTSWIPAGGSEALFLSRAALFRPGSAIRGGIPLVFPQFSSTGPLPKHGFARTRAWELLAPAEGEAARDRAALRLRADDATRALWPHDFVADLTVALGERSLTVELEVHNPGAHPFSFTAALHSYLRVADVRQASVVGLRGTRYRDAKAEIGDPLVEDGSPAVRVAGLVDRLYADAPRRVELRDPAGGRTLAVDSQGFRDTVVWNPWIELAASLADMEDEEYLEMLCVEAAQVEQPVELAPGERWRGAQRLEAVA